MGLATNSALDSSDWRAAISACTRCPALVRSRSRVVPGDGAIPADVAFIGLAPGRLGGDRTGIPFSGDRSGDLLRAMIQRAGLERVFITNLVRCNPRDAQGRNRDPDRAEIVACRSHLDFELALARPRIVACLGRTAWSALAGRDKPFDPRHPTPLAANGFHLFPMYHPAYINRGACSQRIYAAHFRRLARLLEQGAAESATRGQVKSAAESATRGQVKSAAESATRGLNRSRCSAGPAPICD